MRGGFETTDLACKHAWVVPVKRYGDVWLQEQAAVDMTTEELLQDTRGIIIERLIICRFCEAKPEEGK